MTLKEQRDVKQEQRLAQILAILPKLRLEMIKLLKEEVDRIVRVREKMDELR